MAGLFVTFEGGEGSGKTTQLRTLLLDLRAKGREVIDTRDPGGTPIGKQVREMLLDRDNGRMTPVTELYLYEASRAQLVSEVIRPALAAGQIVLCDRFTDSTLAYQGYGRGLDLALIRRLNELATGGLTPDLTFLLDLPPEAGLARIRDRQPGARGDRIELEVLAFHQAVRRGYLSIAAAEPGRVAVLDGTRGMGDIAEEVRRQVDARLGSGGDARPAR